MFRFGVLTALLILVLNITTGFAAEIKLNNGDIYRGQPTSFNDDGLVVSLEIGGFSPRIAWGNLTQETLKELAADPRAKDFAEPFIEIPPEVKQAERQKSREIRVVEPPTKVAHVQERTGFFSAMANPLGYALLAILYLSNLYAGAEVARWRGRPMVLGIGLAAIVPILGPIILALLPAGNVSAETTEVEAPVVTDGVNPMQQALPSGMAGSSLGLANVAGGKAAANPAYTMVHNRNNATFDRRFFETKFSGFFRVMPADAEKDLVIVVKTPKQELVATRISRISASEIHFQLQRGGAETSVGLGEIMEVSVRPKGAK